MMWSLIDSLDRLALVALPVLLDAAVKGAALLALAGLATLAMRGASAATRHLVWFLAVASLLAMPVLSVALPAWSVLPSFGSAPVAVETPLPTRVTEGLVLVEPLAGASPATTSAAPRRSIGPLAIGAAVYLLGFAACLLPLVLGSLTLRRLRRGAVGVEHGPLAELLRDCAARLSLRRRVALLQSTDGVMPMTWGALPGDAKVLLPAEASGWSPQRQRVVLLHELAHVKRMDCTTQLVTQVACALHWFNPLAWLAAKRMLVERERACDDLVLAAAARGGEAPALTPADYAEHLLDLARSLQSHLFTRYTAIAMARPSALEGRLLAILDPTRRRGAVTAATLAVGLLVAACVLVPVAMLKAQEPAQAETPAEHASEDPAVSDAQSVKVEPTPVQPEDLIPDADYRIGEQYRIGAMDLLLINVLGLEKPGEDAALQRRVDAEGTIRLPRIGDFHVLGQTKAEVEAAITLALGEREILRDATVSVTVVDIRGNTFDVIAPPDSGTRTGTYAIPRPDFRLLDVIGAIGGVPEWVRTLTVYRTLPDGVQQRMIEVPYRELIAGDPRLNLVIRAGDIIRVPDRNLGFVYVMGAVERPGAYTVPGDREMTLRQMLSMVGAPPREDTPLVLDHVRREGDEEIVRRAVPIGPLLRLEIEDIPLRANDQVRVYHPDWPADGTEGRAGEPRPEAVPAPAIDPADVTRMAAEAVVTREYDLVGLAPGPETAEQIATLVRDTVGGAEEWKRGTTHRLSLEGTRLTVTSSQQNHDQIAALLRQLRETTRAGRDRSTSGALGQRVRVRLARPTLDAALDQTLRAHGVEVFVDYASIDEHTDGIDAATVLDIDEDVEGTMREVLQRVLTAANEAAGSPPLHNELRFRLHNGVVKIGTLRALEPPDLASYDVRDLLAPDGLMVGVPLDEQELARIIDRVRSTVGPRDTWDDRGGDLSSIRGISGQLIVRTIPTYHLQIERMLSELREQRAAESR